MILDVQDKSVSAKMGEYLATAKKSTDGVEGWAVHAWIGDRQIVSAWCEIDCVDAIRACRLLVRWLANGQARKESVVKMESESRFETFADISAELKRLCDKWIGDKSLIKTECLGLIVGQIAGWIDAAAKRERDVFAEIVDIAKSWAEPGADAAITLGLIIDKAESAISAMGRGVANG